MKANSEIPRISRIILLMVALFFVQGCSSSKLFVHQLVGGGTYKIHQSSPHTTVDNDPQSQFSFIEAADAPEVYLPRVKLKGKSYGFDLAMKKLKTEAILVIKDDEILYEKYYNQGDETTRFPSFSMSKSFVSALVGIAISEGAISGVQDPITRYLPELSSPEFDRITIENLLDMQSGIKYAEKYGPFFSDVAKDFIGKNIRKRLRKLKVSHAPGEYFEYRSINTQLLAYIIENSTGSSIQQYLEEKIWKPLGMESPALWGIDSQTNNTVRAFCCLEAVARDYAKFGRLYLNQGVWNGKQVVPAEWVTQSVTFERNKNKFLYSYQWWHNVSYRRFVEGQDLPERHEFYTYRDSQGNTQKGFRSPKTDYFANGHLGQFIYVNPEHNVLIVRLGSKEGEIAWRLLFERIAKGQRSGAN